MSNSLLLRKNKLKPYHQFVVWRFCQKSVINPLNVKMIILIFFLISEKTGLGIYANRPLSKQTIHMKCQYLFSLKNISKNNNLECRLQILLGALRVKRVSKDIKINQADIGLISCYVRRSLILGDVVRFTLHENESKTLINLFDWQPAFTPTTVAR